MTDKITDLLERGTAEIIDLKSLRVKIKSGKKLRVKLGIDANMPDIHLGHVVPFLKLKEFQDAGHKAVVVIGDYTAFVGDPTGKAETRSQVAMKQIENNAKKFLDQIGRIIDLKKAEIHRNSEWYKKFSLLDFLELISKVTVNQLMAHETFRKRMGSGSLGDHELQYPILQGYDSVALKADVELGAVEQKFNLLMGRELQRIFSQTPQDVVMLPYLTGLDGKEKMSKSLANYIALNDAPNEMFGKVMSIPDNLINQYRELLTDLPTVKVTGGPETRKLKAELAHKIVEKFYDKRSADDAQKVFNRVFSQGLVPDEMIEIKVSSGAKIVDLLARHKLVNSNSEAKRLIEQGGVKIDDRKISDINEVVKVSGGEILRVGKRKFAKLIKK